MAQKFQKLNIDLPRQPLADQKVWQVAGWLLAIMIVLITLFSYLDYRDHPDSGTQSIESYQGD